jgi:hypothetical protein
MCSVTAPLLLDQLAAARLRDFVGRQDELALFESVLDRGAGAAVYVYGPGGMGKTSLLHQYAWRGAQRGRRVVRFDAVESGQSTGAVLAGLARAAGLPPASGGPPSASSGPPSASGSLPPASGGTTDPLRALAEIPRLVLLIDSVELLSDCDRWLREDLLARLSADAVVVLAGRHPPALGWRTDPGWRDMLRVVRLRELDSECSRMVLRQRGLPEQTCDAAMAFARGHPLALALAAEIGPDLAGRLGVPGPQAAPEALRDLLAGLLDAVPGPLHRGALEASSQVLVTTEPLLAALLGVPDVHEVFGWLRGLSVMEHTERGVRPHELVRDLLSAELRWRDPDRYAQLHRRAGEYYQGRLHAGDSVLFEFAYLHRESPVLGPYLAGVAPGSAGPGSGGSKELGIAPMSPGEWPRLRQMLVRHEGEESAQLADRWSSPATVSVPRAPDGVPAGFVLLLALETLDSFERDADPATAAAWRWLSTTAPLGSGETAWYVRWWLGDEEYQGISAAQTKITLHLARLYLTIPGLAVTFLPVADPDFWAEACDYADLRRLPEADFTVGGRQYGVYVHDWRTVPPLAWLQLLAAREVVAEPLPPAQPPRRPAPAPAGPAQLSEAEFVAEIRAVLRELGRPDRLGDSPLLRAVMMSREGVDAPGTSAGTERGRLLERVIRDAAAVLADSAHDRRAYRALHHTYLQPAGTQQRAAELLDLPMSTYRRHLAEGLDRLAAILWRQELDARAESGHRMDSF